MSVSVLSPDIRGVIAKLEETSGYPVSYFEDPALTVLATIQTGTPANPVHVIRYRPGEQPPDYQVAVEVGYALRMFARSPERRFHLSSNDEYRTDIINQIRALHPDLDAANATNLGIHLFDGLLRQLRSVPVGLLIDIWIHSRLPALRPLQAASLTKQCLDNTQSLSKEMEIQYPKTIVYGNRSMNAAQAIFVADLLDQSHLAVPYRAAGLGSIATALLTHVTQHPVDEIDDQSLINAWAEHLGVNAWIKWLPFS